MVPDKFNMVDMEGIDLIDSQGVVIEGLYDKLVESIAQCRYQCLYNWKFDGVVIPPSYVEMEVDTDTGDVIINEGVTVDVDDIVHIHSLEIIINPVIQELNISENGEYLVPEGVDGFNPVSVEVIRLLQQKTVTENGDYEPDEGYYGLSKVSVEVIPPLQQKSVTENGEYEPDEGYYGLSKVLVNVPSGLISYDEHYTDIKGYISGTSYYYSSTDNRNLTLYHLTPNYHYYVFRKIAASNRFRLACFSTNPIGSTETVNGEALATSDSNISYNGFSIAMLGSKATKPYLVVDLGSNNPDEIPYVLQLED